MTNRQRKALAALIQSPTIKEAATASGVGYTTLRDWLRSDTEFIAEYKRAVDQIMDDAIFQARQNLSPALSALRKIIQDDEQNGAVVAQASRTLLEYGLKMTERADLRDRIEALEDQDELC